MLTSLAKLTAAHNELVMSAVILLLSEGLSQGNLIQWKGSDSLKTALETRGKTA